MNEQHPIGLTKGPGETPNEFTFVSPDRGQVLSVDSRVATQEYGKVLLRSLPGAKRIRVSIDGVGRSVRSFRRDDQ